MRHGENQTVNSVLKMWKICKKYSLLIHSIVFVKLWNHSCPHALHAPLQQSSTKGLSLNKQGCISLQYKKIYIGNWGKHYQKQWGFYTSMQSGSNMIHCCNGWKKLNSLYGMTLFILSPGTDLLILKGQTGTIHNVTMEYWGLSSHCNEKAIYWDDNCWGSICFPSSGVSAITLTNSPCILSPQTHFPSPWHVPNLERS